MTMAANLSITDALALLSDHYNIIEREAYADRLRKQIKLFKHYVYDDVLQPHYDALGSQLTYIREYYEKRTLIINGEQLPALCTCPTCAQEKVLARERELKRQRDAIFAESQGIVPLKVVVSVPVEQDPDCDELVLDIKISNRRSHERNAAQHKKYIVKRTRRKM